MTLNDAILGEQPVMEEMSPAVHFGDRERERERKHWGTCLAKWPSTLEV
jgi:hypothetical protein